jgi:hypothetical protein
MDSEENHATPVCWPYQILAAEVACRDSVLDRGG